MSKMKLLFVMAFTICASAFAQVNVAGNAPQTGGTYTLPIILSAKATPTAPNTITGWAVYFGNNEYYSSQTGLNGQLDVTINNAPLGAGQQVTITAFDNTGAPKSYVATNVTVVASPLPAIPSNATAFTNLQVQVKQPSSADQGWAWCDDNSCSGSSTASKCTDAVSFGVAGTPSLSGASMLQTISGPYCNILNYRKFACPQSGCKAISHLLEDMWFQTSSTSQMQGSEFDPDLFDGAAEYQLSTQCRLLSAPGTAAGVWYLWNMNANTWEPTQYPCTASTIAPGIWHHYQLYGTVNTATPGSQTQTYQTFVFDGKVVFQNIGTTYGAAQKTTSGFVNVQAQIDNASQSNATNTNYYDNYNLYVW